ncbi:phage protease [Psychrobacter sp. HD31]|uniref:phage protease n=1 Tax=Psychrobacter sp. HD31 TaxID=3112003 RepID=UPI003DA30C0A
MKKQLRTDLNAQTKTELVTALCTKLPPVVDDLWWPLIPVGKVEGKDGRSWQNDDAQAVIDNTQLPFLLDIDHASELTNDTRASGWFEELKITDGFIYARVDPTKSGAKAINEKDFKFYSPALNINKKTGQVHSFSSVGLTNKPNLDVPALNKKQGNQQEPQTQTQTQTQTKQKDNTMLDALLKALGLPPDADQATALNAIQVLKTATETNAMQQQQPDLNSFVPKATHDQTVTELNAANAKLQEMADAKHNEAVEVAINQAIDNKKIAPADKDYYTAQCATEQGLADFTKFADNKAAIIGDSNLQDKPPKKEGDAELNAQDIQKLESMGIVV